MIEKTYNDELRALRLAHELAHYHTYTLSSINSSSKEIKYNEEVANEFVNANYLIRKEEKK